MSCFGCPVLDRVAAIAAGDDHNLALTDDGRVWAWGANGEVQLGVAESPSCGPSTNPIGPCRPQPLPVPGLEDVAAIAAGTDHNLALDRAGVVWGWGENRYGQAGSDVPPRNCDRSEDPCRPAPARVPGLGRITAIAAGPAHSVALDEDGAVWAWGVTPQAGPDSGEMCGEANLFYPCRTIPARVPDLPAIVQVAAHWNHTLALDRDGVVWAWGGNESAQLGNGRLTETGAPVRIEIPGGVEMIDAGDEHSLALGRDGSVWMWGALPGLPKGKPCGFELREPACAYTPIPALPPGSASALIPGGSTAIVATDGSLHGWSSDGEFGPGVPQSLGQPLVPASSLPDDLVALERSAQHSLALTARGSVLAQGWNGLGQLGR